MEFRDYGHHLSVRGRVHRIVRHVLAGIVLGVAFALLIGAVVMWLWNGIVPNILPAHTITYWQSVGLLVLARILVGGFGRGGGHRRRPRGGVDAWREYDDWWRSVGEHSFREFSKAQRERNVPQGDI
jgi:hypothetical protein